MGGDRFARGWSHDCPNSRGQAVQSDDDGRARAFHACFDHPGRSFGLYFPSSESPYLHVCRNIHFIVNQKQTHYLKMSTPELITQKFALRTSLVVVLGWLLFPVTLGAQTAWVWTHVGTSSFGLGSNWSGGVVPTAAESAIINNAGTATITTGDTFAMADFVVGPTEGTGHVIQSGGAISVRDLAMGPHSSSTYEMSGGTVAVSRNIW